ncbi:MAG: IS5 family transposase [Luteolibacter sp.]
MRSVSSSVSRPDQIYPSDLNRKQFEVIRPLLEGARKKTAPHQVDRLHIFNGVLYILREGCRRRSLPKDYPDWNLCYYYYRVWRDHTDAETNLPLLELVLKKLVSGDRASAGKEEQTTFLIIDAQSVKNTDPAEQKGYDAGKKVSGIKRHLAVDSRGLPHLLHVTTANISDKAGAKEMLQAAAGRLQRAEAVLVDGGYGGRPFADFVQEQLNAKVEVAKRNEPHTFAVIPKRWVVERTISWLEKCRRLWKNCERKLSSSLAMIRPISRIRPIGRI